MALAKGECSIRSLTVNTVILLWLSWPVQAETVSCEGSDATVTASRLEGARQTCEAVARAQALFEGCNVPPIVRPLRVELIDEINPNCFGQYHCGEDRIELLEPSAVETKRLRGSSRMRRTGRPAV